MILSAQVWECWSVSGAVYWWDSAWGLESACGWGQTYQSARVWVCWSVQEAVCRWDLAEARQLPCWWVQASASVYDSVGEPACQLVWAAVGVCS